MRFTTTCLAIAGVSVFCPSDSRDGPAENRHSSNPSISAFVAKMIQEGKKPNRLIHEKSPYLLQHAFNPVNWYPWGEGAFQKAKDEQKPIFLSIGYSTCHWCHVMERESFENDSIATLLNSWFVPIKVDREERPDVDRIYMAAIQGMGQSGGWPMSVFLTPDLKPFYGGTYFPPETRYGRIGFPELLRRIREIWDNQREKVLDSADGIAKYLAEASSTVFGGENPDASALDTCYEQIKSSYDPEFGGFGGGPKFPRPVIFNFLLRYYSQTGKHQALEMAERTLAQMANGGLCDHIGGGFHRYSVDAEWRVPHFEKMLYDQSQLAASYLELFQVTKNSDYSRVAREVLDYLVRDMRDPSGGFYSAEDADSPRPENPSEEGEGAFYVWASAEIIKLLGEEKGRVFNWYYGVEEGGNALSDPQHEFTGRNILYVANPLEVTAKRFAKTEREIAELLANARSVLLSVRQARPRPHLDDKILTSWNGLTIGALARASQALGEEKYLRAAEQAAGFIIGRMYDPARGGLYHRYRDGEASIPGHLDDYAFLVSGLIDLYEASFSIDWLEKAISLTEKQVEIFWDTTRGGFYDTAGDDSFLLVRTREHYDGAEPAGNSVAALNLLRLADMTDRPEWRDRAEAIFRSVSRIMEKQPSVMPQMMAAFDYAIGKTQQIILVGSVEDSRTKALAREVYSRFLPRKVILLFDRSDGAKSLDQYFPFASTLTTIEGKPTAYVCEDYVCQLPTTEPKTMVALLENRKFK